MLQIISCLVFFLAFWLSNPAFYFSLVIGEITITIIDVAMNDKELYFLVWACDYNFRILLIAI